MRIRNHAGIRAARLTGAVLAAGLLVAGCVVAPAPVPVAIEADEVYAPVAPPVAPVELVPVLPFPGAVWLGGYWNWSSGRHVWVPGHYVRPRPGYRWEPYRWEPRARGGWSLRGGIWVR